MWIAKWASFIEKKYLHKIMRVKSLLQLKMISNFADNFPNTTKDYDFTVRTFLIKFCKTSKAGC